LIDDSTIPCLSAMTEHFIKDGDSVLAVQPVPWHEINQYGVVSVEDPIQSYSAILDMIEKPQREFAPSNLAAVGRYVFTSAIFKCLKQTIPDHRGEIQLTDAIHRLLNEQKVQAYQFLGKRYDCGSKLGYLQATVEFGMHHSEIGLAFTQYLQNLKIVKSIQQATLT
ncbi:MAG: UTP--glucose-1-phosphate uridylyltransferase, partial [Tatlockia sp.]|nr:UTP--glucose-1-phosphate uridylyltransferase [Tatlockia sp.]